MVKQEFHTAEGKYEMSGMNLLDGQKKGKSSDQ